MVDVMGLGDTPALVVGGGSGIGRATARLLAAAGAGVAMGDIDEDRAVTSAAFVFRSPSAEKPSTSGSVR